MFNILLPFILFSYSAIVYSGCGEENKMCFRFKEGKMIYQSKCKVVECANMEGGIQEWTWDNGDIVTIRINENEILVDGKPGYAFDKAEKLCYGIGDNTNKTHYVCYTDDKQENADTKKEACKQILVAGMYNGILEELCDFNGGVKNHLKGIYAAGKCQDIIDENEIHRVSKEVLEDTRSDYQAIGMKLFCENNRKSYYDLVDGGNN